MRLISSLKERLVDRATGSPPGDRDPAAPTDAVVQASSELAKAAPT
jgi:hypothetical protein